MPTQTDIQRTSAAIAAAVAATTGRTKVAFKLPAGLFKNLGSLRGGAKTVAKGVVSPTGRRVAGGTALAGGATVGGTEVYNSQSIDPDAAAGYKAEKAHYDRLSGPLRLDQRYAISQNNFPEADRIEAELQTGNYGGNLWQGFGGVGRAISRTGRTLIPGLDAPEEGAAYRRDRMRQQEGRLGGMATAAGGPDKSKMVAALAEHQARAQAARASGNEQLAQLHEVQIRSIRSALAVSQTVGQTPRPAAAPGPQGPGPFGSMLRPEELPGYTAARDAAYGPKPKFT